MLFRSHTVEHYFEIFRSLIFFDSFKEEKLKGEIEIDESYFGPSRVRGKRGQGAGIKVPVIGLLKRNGKVFTKRFYVVNCGNSTVKIKTDSIIF